jgi:hypothetical protein
MEIDKFKKAKILLKRTEFLEALKPKIKEINASKLIAPPINSLESALVNMVNQLIIYKEDLQAINEFIDQRIEKLKQEFNEL